MRIDWISATETGQSHKTILPTGYSKPGRDLDRGIGTAEVELIFFCIPQACFGIEKNLQRPDV